MEKLTVGLVYGQALFDAAKESGKTRKIGEEYKAVSRVFSENPDLKKLLDLPTVTAKTQKSVAGKVFGGRVSDEMLAFICILIEKRRMSAWDGIGKAYEKLVWDSEGYTKGVLYSVIPVGKDRLKAFEQKTAQTTGKRVKLENRIDKTIIGGAKIYIDGKLIDASLKARLENMKQRIK